MVEKYNLTYLLLSSQNTCYKCPRSQKMNFEIILIQVLSMPLRIGRHSLKPGTVEPAKILLILMPNASIYTRFFLLTESY